MKGKTIGIIGVIIAYFGIISLKVLTMGAFICCIGIVYDAFEIEVRK